MLFWSHVVMYLVTKVKMAHLRALFMVNLEGKVFAIIIIACSRKMQISK